MLALANAPANAQAGATPATPDNRESAHPSTASELRETSAQPPTTDDVCRALEQSAAENALPVEFFARVIWQESRFDARAVSTNGAEGIAQFMPATASWHGLADPFDPMESLSRDRWDKSDTPRAILASLPPTTVRCAHARRHDLLNGGFSFQRLQ
jgi:soluble lytic murein transglycosylase-like protein